jgi:hypothetical protein
MIQTMYTSGIKTKSISKLGYSGTFQMAMRFAICNAVDKHEEYTYILEVKKTYSDRGGHNPEESDYYDA